MRHESGVIPYHNGNYFRLDPTDHASTAVVCPICATVIENDRSGRHHYDYPCPTCKSYIYGWGAALYIRPASYKEPEYTKRWERLVRAGAKYQMSVMMEIEEERARILGKE